MIEMVYNAGKNNDDNHFTEEEVWQFAEGKKPEKEMHLLECTKCSDKLKAFRYLHENFGGVYGDH
ncbi:MAG: hypothetical protein COU90_01245 [Candidatus Ryanbacteria bacterium CG10_big_fil_rev_8_21_14_0_10_43_42]|uniref:Uncharacterized protein n=1 Tax=Candidatus Ryanbacteria bacterium CG10_big_fil_rev_8_21_14_0_10_43_42 TaxID=1974864 RepID=A0A2M8KYA3_9BACT|nr:MAG: hypothetical protein COU90_01245 [Candidatus Ryanbacteria bacterium CG10_big_fil_rev_8_21_14_0_10_43_42]